MNITNAKIFPMGPRKPNQRAAVHWLRKTAFMGLIIMAGTAGAHEEPAVMSVKPQPVAQNIIPAQFAPTPQQAATQKNLWVSAFASLNPWWEGQQNPINFTTNLFKRRAESQPALGVS